MKFNFDDYGENCVMHCETEDAADVFLRYLHSIGKRWCSGSEYIGNTSWRQYGDQTCYKFCGGTFGSLGFFKKFGFRILNFYDFDWESENAVDIQYSFEQLMEGDA